MSSTLLHAAKRVPSRLTIAAQFEFTRRTAPGSMRSYASETMTRGDNDGSSGGAGGDAYESPLRDFFDMIDQGRSSLGTTADQTPKPEARFLKCGVNENALRFRTMHYGRAQLTPHIQPGEHRVIMKVHLEEIPLTDVERDIVKQIVGNRCNEERGELRLASDQFGSRIENKRHLVSMLDRIVLNAKRLAKELEEDSSQRESGGEER